MNLEHLDDPQGFVPDDGFRAAVRRAGRRRRIRRRVALASGSVLTTMALVVAALAGYGLWRTSQIDRVDVDFAAPPVSLDEPFNILLIGSDSREGTGDADLVAGARSDTMIVARVLPAERRVVLLSLPRDLAVAPLDGGEPERLNAAFAEGGPAQLVETVETRLGIPLSAYVEVDFEGLVDLVDQSGGLPVSVSAPLRDESTGLELEPSECTVLDGLATLALVRSRHLEALGTDGRWREDPTSDIGRMFRQRLVLQIAAERLGSLVGSIGGVDAALDLAADHLTIDERLGTETALALAGWLADSPAPVVDSLDLPVVGTMVGSMSLLALDDGAATTIAAVGGSVPSETAEAAGALVPGGGGAVGGSSLVQPISHCP